MVLRNALQHVQALPSAFLAHHGAVSRAQLIVLMFTLKKMIKL